MNEPRIRLATPSDVGALCRMRLAIFQETGAAIAGQEPVFLEASRTFYARLFGEGIGVAWVAEADEPVAALTLLFHARMPSPKALGIGEGYVTGVYTDPAWRGRGLATRLMERAIDESRSRGMARIRLSATKAGRRVYIARGFVPRDDAMELEL